VLALLAGICIESESRVCPPGSTRVPGFVVIYAGAGVALVIGLLWLIRRSGRG
jgi:hypothetical protein